MYGLEYTEVHANEIASNTFTCMKRPEITINDISICTPCTLYLGFLAWFVKTKHIPYLHAGHFNSLYKKKHI